MKSILFFLGVAVSAIVILVPALATAVPPNASIGYALVDGSYAEWNTTADFFSDMFRAGKPDKPLESKLYLRYDCTTATMYALVLCEPDVPGYIDPTATTAWIAIDAQNNKVVDERSGNSIPPDPPDFAWVGQGYDGNLQHVQGYEASFRILLGTYRIIAHIDVWDGVPVSVQTSATPGFPKEGPDLVVPNCQTAVESTSWGVIKALYR